MRISFTRRIAGAAVLALVACVALAVMGREYLGDIAFLSVGIATASFVLSAIAAFRSEIFGAMPGVSGGDVVWLQTSPYTPAPILALPLFLRNDGYGDAVLQWLAITVQGPGWTKPVPFETVVEVNMAKVYEQIGRYDQNAIMSPLTRVALPSKQIIAKTIQFAPSIEPREGPLVWKPGTYHFRVFIKIEGDKKPFVALEFTFDHKPKDLADHATGRTIIFPNTGYKRELVGPEWGPQLPKAS